MKSVLAIAVVTVREALRQKLAVNLLLFALLVIAGSIVLSELTFGEQYRIIADLALSSAQVFGTLIAVFLGAGMVAGDVQRRVLYPILAKPIGRWQYLLGRYLGLVVTLWLNLAVMGATTAVVFGVYLGGADKMAATPLAPALLGLAAQLAVVGAVAILFSAFTNPTLAAIFTLSLVVAGHFVRELLIYWRGLAPLRAVGLLLPNLAALDYKVNLVYQEPVAAGALGLALLHAALYVATSLALASAVFGRRDLR
jgi:ABC-type transport system involved in multi-copper enzyme maturation permease subunit